MRNKYPEAYKMSVVKIVLKEEKMPFEVTEN
jgi:hypothetical protein